MSYKKHFQRMLDDVEKNSNGRSIVLWGYCDQTSSFRDVLLSCGYEVPMIVDSNRKIVDNKNVHTVLELENSSDTYYVVVPITYYVDIETKLQGYGYTMGKDYSYAQKDHPLPNRKDFILRFVAKEKLGLEIGASYNPLAPKRNGYKVHVIDHLDKAGLIEKYRHLAVDTSKIEDVDYIWAGQAYKDLTPYKYGWIIASHVIEHVPDFIKFLNDCADILMEDGVLSLAIPDKRFCFDHFRSLTSLAQVIDKHLLQARLHTPGTLTEFYLNTCRNQGRTVWGAYSANRDYSMLHSAEEAKNRFLQAVESTHYIDAHAHCFVPHSFRLMIQDLYELGFIRLREVDFQTIRGAEFYMTLGLSSTRPVQDRLLYLQKIEDELREGDSPCAD